MTFEFFIDCSSAADLLMKIEMFHLNTRLENRIKIQAFPDLHFNGYGVGTRCDGKTQIWQHPGATNKDLARNVTIIALIKAVLVTTLQKSLKHIFIISHPKTVFSGLQYFVQLEGHKFTITNDLKTIQELIKLDE